MATLAAVFAMTGGAIAATSGFTSGGKLTACANSQGLLKLLKPGKKCKHGQKAVTWNQAGPAGPRGATGAQGATATTATSALTANNALLLGGTPASGFTHDDCFSETGQIKGFAMVPANPAATFTKLETAYNCSGEPVEAERTTKGKYIVRFLGSPAVIAIGTSNGESGVTSDAISVHTLAPGEWSIESSNVEHGGEENAAQFELLVP